MRAVVHQKMLFKCLCLMFVLIVPLEASTLCFAETSFVVIVNSENSFSAEPEEMKVVVSRLFLKKQSAWPGGELVKPYDRSPKSMEHQQFVQDILKIGEGKLLEHWAKMKQIRGETPPRSIKATSILLKLIRKNKGGLGVVGEEVAMKLPDGVKVLFAF